jgi:hypothetical protein
MSTPICMRVANAIMPAQLLKQIQEGHSLERNMTATARLLVNLVRNTIICLKQHKIRALDANPADRQCQLRAIILRSLTADQEMMQEALALEKVANTAAKQLHARHQTKRRVHREPVEIFFENNISAKLQVSRKMLYLLDCRLMTLTKIKDHVEDNGIVVTKTSISPLSKLAKKGIEDIAKEQRGLMLGIAAARLSATSIQLYQELCSQLTVSPVMSRMMLQVRQGKTYRDHPPKSFGCQFYEVQAVLMHLKQQKAIIAIKTVVTEGNPCHLMFQSTNEHEEFTFLKKETTKGLPLETRIVVFEGVIGSDTQTFLKKVQEVGLSRMILACAAQEEPFEHGSTLETVTDPEAHAEIVACRKDAERIGCQKEKDPVLLLDHVFCNSLKEENV